MGAPRRLGLGLDVRSGVGGVAFGGRAAVLVCWPGVAGVEVDAASAGRFGRRPSTFGGLGLPSGRLVSVPGMASAADKAAINRAKTARPSTNLQTALEALQAELDVETDAADKRTLGEAIGLVKELQGRDRVDGGDPVKPAGKAAVAGKVV